MDKITKLIKQLEEMIKDDEPTKNHLLNKLSDIYQEIIILNRVKENTEVSLNVLVESNKKLKEQYHKIKRVVNVLLDEEDEDY